jgi:hypothetical protein
VHKRTDPAASTINGSDRLVVELIEADDLPPIVSINWPAKPTVARASTELARIKSGL